MKKAFVLFSNLILILGVIFLDWNVLEILLIYWAECVVMGVIYVIKGIYLKSRYSEFKFIANFVFLPHFCAMMFGFYGCIIIFWVKGWYEGISGPLDLFKGMVDYFSDPFMFILLLLIAGSYLFSFLFEFIPNHKRHKKIVEGRMFFQEVFVRTYTIYIPIIIAGGLVLFFNSILASTIINSLPISVAKIGLIGIIIFKIFIELKNYPKNPLL